jgi:hypothetical protein
MLAYSYLRGRAALAERLGDLVERSTGMKKSKRREPAVIRAWAEEEDKKITIQIEDGDGETLAFIQLTPDKASEFSDCLAIYAAKLKMASREKNAPRSTSMRPAFLC